MSEWKEYKLGEIAEVTSAKRIFYSEYVPTGVPFYRSKEIIDLYNKRNVATELFISEERFNEIKKKYGVPQENDILLTSVGSLGVPYIVTQNDEFYFKDGNLTWIKSIDTKRLLPQYLRNWIISSIGKQKLDEITIGSTQPALTITGLKSMTLFLPPIEDQQRIAGVLSSLDDKIDLLNRENVTLESLAETLFRHYFIENPDPTWKEGKLGDEFDFTMGQSPSGDSFNEDGIGIPMYQGNADFGFRFPTRRVFTTAPTRFADANDTLISVRAPVGAQNMATERCCIGRGVAAFRYKHEKDYYSYTYYKLKSLLEEIKSFNDNGTVFGSISKSDFENIDVVIPDKDSIVAFQLQVMPFDEKIRNNHQQILALSTQRDILLSRLMSGEEAVEVQ